MYKKNKYDIQIYPTNINYINNIWFGYNSINHDIFNKSSTYIRFINANQFGFVIHKFNYNIPYEK